MLLCANIANILRFLTFTACRGLWLEGYFLPNKLSQILPFLACGNGTMFSKWPIIIQLMIARAHYPRFWVYSVCLISKSKFLLQFLEGQLRMTNGQLEPNSWWITSCTSIREFHPSSSSLHSVHMIPNSKFLLKVCPITINHWTNGQVQLCVNDELPNATTPIRTFHQASNTFTTQFLCQSKVGCILREQF